jgi:predicted enzyme related to lactoylglutathione lyase
MATVTKYSPGTPTVASTEGLAATLMVGPVDIPPGRFAILVDPTGAMFAVIQPTSA